MSTLVREKNNVIYVEPNYNDAVGMYGRDGYTNFEVAPHLEDYSIFVNLKVERRGRMIQSNSSSNNDTLVLSWYDDSNGRGAVNFMQGSKIPLVDGSYMHSLTTNYTDIHIEDLKSTRGNTEMFGISSIDISYNNYMVPEVTIKFVDVRGASIFAAKQMAATNEGHDTAVSNVDDTDIAAQFFECFFTFPYPKFTLTVKGFYGNPVSYELTLADFRASFESSTGNFSCTAKFVGYYFSFLNDVMINDMFAAPYSDYLGADYWKSMNFKVTGVNGEEVSMPRINEVIQAVKKGLTNSDKYERSNPLIRDKKDNEDKIIALRSLKNIYNGYVTMIDSYCQNVSKDKGIETYFREIDSNGDTKEAMLFVSRSDVFSAYTGDRKGEINGRYASLKKSITDYNNSNSANIPCPDNIASDNNLSNRVVVNNKHASMAPKSSVQMNGVSDEIYNRVSNKVESGNSPEFEINPFINYQHTFHYKDNGFTDTVLSLIEQTERAQEEIEKQIESKNEDSIVKELGFRPTVENMTKIIMAHFETFMYMLYKTGELISDSKRTIDSLRVGGKEDLPDVPNRMLPIVPPFPKVTRKEYDSKSDTWRRIETWLDNFHGESFMERDMVHGILNGVKIVNDVMNESSNRDSTVKRGHKYEMPSIHPLTPYDFVSYDKIYGDFSSKNLTEIVGLIAVRALYVLGITTFKDMKKYSKSLGRAEGKNFISECKPSEELILKLSCLKADEIVSGLIGIENGLMTKDSSGQWPWSSNGSMSFMNNEGIVELFGKNNNDFSTVPIKKISWDSIKNDVFLSDASVRSDDYINTKSMNDGDNVVKGNVFHVDFEYDKYAQIVENTLKGFSGLEDYTSKIETLCYPNKDKIDEFINKDVSENYITYTIKDPYSIKPYEYSCILPTSKELAENKNLESIKLFGRGFDMDDFHKNNIDGEWKYSVGEQSGTTVLRESGGASAIDIYAEDPLYNLSRLTICEFPGVVLSQDNGYINLYTTNKVSLFGSSFYYAQTNTKIRAILFLESITSSFNRNLLFSRILNENNDYPMVIVPYSILLLIGGILWYNKNKENVKFNDINESYKDKPLNVGNTIYYKQLSKLRTDVKNKLTNMFLDWVENSNGNIKSFEEIRHQLELKFKDAGGYKSFFNKLGETEEIDIFGVDRTWFKDYNGKKYTTLLNFLNGELCDNFFDAYITIDEDVEVNDKTSITSYRGIRLGNRDTCREMEYARDIALTPCMLVKNCDFFDSDSNKLPKVERSVMQSFFDGFIDALKPSEEKKDTDKLSLAEETETEEEIKLGIYRYCKLVYDKWVGGLTSERFRKGWTQEKFFNNDDRYFYFIDSYYNEIGQDILINISEFCDYVENSWSTNNQSLLQLLSTMYSKNKMLFLCLQNFLDLSDNNSMRTMFDPIPYNEIGLIKTNPNFVVIHPYEPSSHLDLEGSDYDNDGFMLNDFDNATEWPEPLRAKSAMPVDKCKIPAFGVSYGKMYQSYFTDIDVSMENPTVTEQSINAMYNIAAANSEDSGGDSRSRAYTMGQDLFTIYSNNSYTCNVTMMGCTWVQPLMYFVLTNIPMFRGTYLIEKVSHHVEPGNITTKFMGVRMAKTASAIVKRVTARGTNDNNDSGYIKNNNIQDTRSKAATIDNDCPYKTFPLSPVGFDDIDSIAATNSTKENKMLLMHALAKMGYSKYAAAAVAGNVDVECRFVQGVIDGRQKANNNEGMKGGMCQWQLDRLTRLITDDMNATGITVSGGPMPSYGKQIKFLDYELKNRYKPSYQALMSAKSESDVSGATEIFRKNYEGGAGSEERIEHANQALKEYEDNLSNITIPMVERNADLHINDYPIMLLDALNRSIDYTGSDLNVGIDEAKSSGNTIWLTRGRGERDGLSLAFDVLMNAYKDKVSEIKWVTSENSLPNEPETIIVTAINNPNRTKVSVVFSNNIYKSITLDKNILNNDGAMNKNFSKTIAKVYKSADNPELTEEVSSITNDGKEAIFGSINIENCPVNEQVDYSDLESEASCYVVNGEQNALNLEIYVKNLHCWQKNICEKYDGEGGPRKRSTKKGYNGCGLCTASVDRALKYSGLKRFTGGNANPMVFYERLSKSSEWKEVGSGTTTGRNLPENVEVKVGDIVTMWNKNKTHYHTCSYDGSKWISDYVQNYCIPKYGCEVEWHLMRFKNVV